jgi:hypothetical protein
MTHDDLWYLLFGFGAVVLLGIAAPFLGWAP